MTTNCMWGAPQYSLSSFEITSIVTGRRQPGKRQVLPVCAVDGPNLCWHVVATHTEGSPESRDEPLPRLGGRSPGTLATKGTAEVSGGGASVREYLEGEGCGFCPCGYWGAEDCCCCEYWYPELVYCCC